MHFRETPIEGAFIIAPERHNDERGFFARTFCTHEFAAHGLDTTVAQCNLSHNAKRGTLRGMHYQRRPSSETKLVRCTRGAIFDAIVDLRPESPSYLTSFTVELSESNGLALYIPEMTAHGFLTLADDTDVFYQMGAVYAPEYAHGLRYDDPSIGIQWREPVRVIAPKDLDWPLLETHNTR